MWSRFRSWQRRNPHRSRRIGLVVGAWGLLCLVGDLLAAPPVTELPAPDPSVAEAYVLSGGLDGALDYVAVHTWFVVHDQREATWERWEICGGGVFVESNDLVRRNAYPPVVWPHGSGPTKVLHRWSGSEAQQLIAVLRERTYKHDTLYFAWPGPNSNTYVDRMIRRAGLSYDLPSTAVGRDYRGWVGASQSSTLSGVQLESPLLGVKLGAAEGFELHLASATLGVDFWPPALKVPYGDGRFGWDE